MPTENEKGYAVLIKGLRLIKEILYQQKRKPTCGHTFREEYNFCPHCGKAAAHIEYSPLVGYHEIQNTYLGYHVYDIGGNPPEVIIGVSFGKADPERGLDSRVVSIPMRPEQPNIEDDLSGRISEFPIFSKGKYGLWLVFMEGQEGRSSFS